MFNINFQICFYFAPMVHHSPSTLPSNSVNIWNPSSRIFRRVSPNLSTIISDDSLLGREISRQWLPPSPTFYTRRSPIEPSQNQHPDRFQLITKHWLPNGRHVDLPDSHITLPEAFDFLLRPRQSSPYTLASDDIIPVIHPVSAPPGTPQRPVAFTKAGQLCYEGLAWK